MLIENTFVGKLKFVFCRSGLRKITSVKSLPVTLVRFINKSSGLNPLITNPSVQQSIHLKERLCGPPAPRVPVSPGSSTNARTAGSDQAKSAPNVPPPLPFGFYKITPKLNSLVLVFTCEKICSASAISGMRSLVPGYLGAAEEAKSVLYR